MRKLLIVLLLLFAVAAPVLAQDNILGPEVATSTAEAESNPVLVDGTVIIQPPEQRVVFDAIPVSAFVPFMICITAIILGALGAIAYSNGVSVKALWQSQPIVLQTGGRSVLEYARNEASKTETPADDMAIDALAKQLGYKSEKLSDGRIIFTPESEPEPSKA